MCNGGQAKVAVVGQKSRGNLDSGLPFRRVWGVSLASEGENCHRKSGNEQMAQTRDCGSREARNSLSYCSTTVGTLCVYEAVDGY